MACFVLSGALIIHLGKQIDNEANKTLICFGVLFLTTLFCLILSRQKTLSSENLKDKYGKYIVFPQFCFAVSISYCRIRLGFLYGVLLHMVWNVLPALSVSL